MSELKNSAAIGPPWSGALQSKVIQLFKYSSTSTPIPHTREQSLPGFNGNTVNWENSTYDNWLGITLKDGFNWTQ